MRDFTVYDERKRVLPVIKAQIYLKDPLVAAQKQRVGLKTVEIAGEACIGTGPVSSRVAVIDEDRDQGITHPGVTLNSKGDAFNLGRRREPVENRRFHQVHVWAVLHKTLELLEASDVLGRQIPWAFSGGRLTVYPHAGVDQNAYYDRESAALHFFYFDAEVDDVPTGETIYTCLSHDIVAHELGHAVLDGLKPYYNEVTSAQTAGFHEYFGDAIALTTALNHREIVVEVAGHGTGDLSTANVISNIAAQFGQGLNEEYGSLQDAYLRNANNTKTMRDMVGVQEEHDLSAVPTGAYYDLLRGVYEHLMKSQDRKKGNERVKALMTAAGVTRRMLLRALDYCPPVDLQFVDYAQAVIRADRVAFPIDSSGYRDLAIKIFEKRKLAANLDAPDEELKIQNNQLRWLNIDVLAASRTDTYRFLDANRAVFRIPAEANIDVINLYRTKKTGANDYRVPQEIVIEFVWQEWLTLKGARFGSLKGSLFPLWCGGTVVLSREGNLLHYVVKQNDAARRKSLQDYLAYLVGERYLSVSGSRNETESDAVRHHSKIIAKIEEGRVRLSRTAALRHSRCKPK